MLCSIVEVFGTLVTAEVTTFVASDLVADIAILWVSVCLITLCVSLLPPVITRKQDLATFIRIQIEKMTPW